MFFQCFDIVGEEGRQYLESSSLALMTDQRSRSHAQRCLDYCLFHFSGTATVYWYSLDGATICCSLHVIILFIYILKTPAPPWRGSSAGRNFFGSTFSQRAVFVSLWALFSFSRCSSVSLFLCGIVVATAVLVWQCRRQFPAYVH